MEYALHVIVGPPEVGKTTLAREILRQVHGLEDDAVAASCTAPPPEEKGTAGLSLHRRCKIVGAALRAHQVCVVDGTNDNVKIRAAYLRAAKEAADGVVDLVRVAWVFRVPSVEVLRSVRDARKGWVASSGSREPCVNKTSASQHSSWHHEESQQPWHNNPPTLAEGFDIIRNVPLAVHPEQVFASSPPPQAPCAAVEALAVDLCDLVGERGESRRAQVSAWLSQTTPAPASLAAESKDSTPAPRLLIVAHISAQSATGHAGSSEAAAVEAVTALMRNSRGEASHAVVAWQGFATSPTSTASATPVSLPAVVAAVAGLLQLRDAPKHTPTVALHLSVVSEAMSADGVQEASLTETLLTSQAALGSGLFPGWSLRTWTELAAPHSPRLVVADLSLAEKLRHVIASVLDAPATASISNGSPVQLENRRWLYIRVVRATSGVPMLPTGLVRQFAEQPSVGEDSSVEVHTMERVGPAPAAVGPPPAMTRDAMPTHLLPRRTALRGGRSGGDGSIITPPAKQEGLKALRDPDAPRRPLSGYMLYAQETRAKVMADLDERNVAAVGKELGRRWGLLTEEQKSPFQARADQLRAEYRLAVQAYVDSGKASAFAARAREAREFDSMDDAPPPTRRTRGERPTADAIPEVSGTQLVEQADGWVRGPDGAWKCEWDEDDDTAAMNRPTDRSDAGLPSSRRTVVPQLGGTLFPAAATDGALSSGTKDATQLFNPLRTKSDATELP